MDKKCEICYFYYIFLFISVLYLDKNDRNSLLRQEKEEKMAINIKEMFGDTLLELVNTKKLEKITVNDLISKTGSQQTDFLQSFLRQKRFESNGSILIIFLQLFRNMRIQCFNIICVW